MSTQTVDPLRACSTNFQNYFYKKISSNRKRKEMLLFAIEISTKLCHELRPNQYNHVSV